MADGKFDKVHVKKILAMPTVELDGEKAQLILGLNGEDGDLSIRDKSGNKTLTLDGDSATIAMGAKKVAGRVRVRNAAGKSTIILEGKDGDILLTNGDLAEDFSVADGETAEPGMVMSLCGDGLLQASSKPYDTRVVGVISGAGSYRPALVLDRQEGSQNRRPVAMVGKAYCFATAESEPITPGDLLTSSDVRGHAMKASDRDRLPGSLIGKALSSLPGGTGLIPIVIALQ